MVSSSQQQPRGWFWMEVSQQCAGPPEDQPPLLSLNSFKKKCLVCPVLAHFSFHENLQPIFQGPITWEPCHHFWLTCEADRYSEWTRRRKMPQNQGTSPSTSPPSSQPSDNTTEPTWRRHRRRESRQYEPVTQEHTTGTVVLMDYHPVGSISDPGIEPARKTSRNEEFLYRNGPKVTSTQIFQGDPCQIFKFKQLN